MKNKILLMLVLLFTFSCADVGFSAVSPEEIPQFDVPKTVQIEKNNDFSSALLSKLLGPTWHLVAGTSADNDLGGLGRYSGIVNMVLGFLNLIAMTAISGMILFQWGIFAATTAHEGKKLGGSMYNSLWVPVRHVLAFSLVVPVANGISLIQIILLSVVSFGINCANLTWDEAGAYIVSHAQTGMIDSSPPFIEEESIALIPSMFSASVVQIVAEGRYGEDGLRNFTPQKLPQTLGKKKDFRQIESSHGGRYVSIYSPLEGKVSVCPAAPRFKRFGVGGLGCVFFPAYKMSIDKGVLVKPEGEEALIYTASMGISQARVGAIIKLWEGVRQLSSDYLNARKIVSKDGGSSKTQESALKLASAYRTTVLDESKKYIKIISSQEEITKSLNSIVDSRNGKSELGWITAGLFSYNLALVQGKIDAITFGGSAQYSPINSDDYTKKLKALAGNTTVYDAFTEASSYANDSLLQGRVYDPISEEGDSPGAVSRMVSGVFLGEENVSNGILATTLSEFKTKDPLVVLAAFGQKCYSLGIYGAIASIGTSAASGIPFVGSIASFFSGVVNSPFVTMGITALFVVGITLLYVIPFSIVGLWIWAVLTWLIAVVQALVASPLWAISHVFPEGTGFAGTSARQGYVLALDLVIRPMLLVTAAIVIVPIWQISGLLYGTLLTEVLNPVKQLSGMGIVGELVLASVIFSTYAFLFFKVFKMLLLDFPTKITTWLGIGSANLFSSSDTSGSGETGAPIAGKMGAMGAAAVGGLASGVGKIARGKGKKDDGDNKGKSKGGREGNIVAKEE